MLLEALRRCRKSIGLPLNLSFLGEELQRLSPGFSAARDLGCSRVGIACTALAEEGLLEIRKRHDGIWIEHMYC